MSHTRPTMVLTLDGAQAALAAALAQARQLQLKVVVVVTDPSGQVLASARMDGAPMMSIGVAGDKAWTVAAFGRPTDWWAEAIGADPGLAALGQGRRFMPVPGGVPILSEGQVVGAIGVSGAGSAQDLQIAEAGAQGTRVLSAAAMEARIRIYFDACNDADPVAIASHFTPDAVHYFPPGMYGGPFIGAEVIAERWVKAVADLGSMWTVDHVIAEPASARAVIEWSHFKTKQGKVLRGDEWYRFDPATGLITEIRAYYASPQSPDLDQLELGGFDYEARGYPLQPPFQRKS